jgi:hypothetical protein
MSGVEGAEREDYDECEAGVGLASRLWVHPKKVMDHAALRSDLRSQKS